jgi:hypothetical protein
MAIKFFKFFRTGTHKAMAGQVNTFSDIDLALTAETYKTQAVKAPLVLGHPDGTAPSLGTVLSIQKIGDSLFAEADVSDTLIDLVRKGAYIERSAAFVRVGGVWVLRHIGFLGAQRPAVKNMGALNFSESALGVMFATAASSTAMIDLSQMGAQVSFSEARQQHKKTYSEVRFAMHDAIKELAASYPEFSYIEAACTVEKLLASRGY